MSSLYLHIPFCSSKCPYCDFYSLVASQRQVDDYVDLLMRNITYLHQHSSDPQAFRTIYFGGGTPSLLSSLQVERILTTINQTLELEDGCEITLEANPGTLKQAKLDGYRRAGINRLSLGIQSLDDRNLRMLGRIHNAEEARQAVTLARRAGFDNLSLDLIFALPGETLSMLSADLDRLLELTPDHVSLYGLTFEEGTDFGEQLKQGALIACHEDLYAEQYSFLHERLCDAGYEHYEISNFSRPGLQCRHNQTYWKRETCWAVGVGAHSFHSRNWGERWAIPRDLKKYRERLTNNENPARLLETFDRMSAAKEWVYLALRTAAGVDQAAFKRLFKQNFSETFPDAIGKVRPYLATDQGRMAFTLDGWLLYDYLISHFL